MDGRVAAVVVSYRTPRRACALGRALAGAMPVLIVECGPVGEAAYDACGGARAIVAGRNIGFGGAVNAAAARLPPTPYLLALNADVEIEPEAVSRLADRLDADPGLAAVAPTLVDAAGRPRLNARPFPSAGDALATRRRRLRAGTAPEVAGDVDWLSGACVLFRRSDFERVGGFDARFFLYWEDADIAWRLARLGRRVAVVPEVRARHEEGASGTSLRTIYHFHASAWRLRRRLVPGRLDGLLAGLALGARALVVMGAHLVTGRRARAAADRPGI